MCCLLLSSTVLVIPFILLERPNRERTGLYSNLVCSHNKRCFGMRTDILYKPADRDMAEFRMTRVTAGAVDAGVK